MSNYQSPQIQPLGGKTGATPQGVAAPFAVVPAVVAAVVAAATVAVVYNATYAWNVNTIG